MLIDVPRLDFSKDDFFNGIKVREAYSKKNQTETIRDIIRDEVSKYINTRDFLGKLLKNLHT